MAISVHLRVSVVFFWFRTPHDIAGSIHRLRRSFRSSAAVTPQAALISIPFDQGLLNVVLDLRFGFAPVRAKQLILRRQAKQALDAYVGIKPLEEINDQIEIILISQQ